MVGSAVTSIGGIEDVDAAGVVIALDVDDRDDSALIVVGVVDAVVSFRFIIDPIANVEDSGMAVPVVVLVAVDAPISKRRIYRRPHFKEVSKRDFFLSTCYLYMCML